MNRRDWLRGAALGLASARMPARLRGVAAPAVSLFHEDHGLAVESAGGYRGALGARLRDSEEGPAIYAGVRELKPDVVARVRGGRWVLVESGLSFAEQRAWGEHREWIGEHFGLRLGERVRFTEADGHYATYDWPVRCAVRHFGEVVPVMAREGEVIARVGAVPVAARCCFGRGGLIYLGSPLGPVLTGGDKEATALAHALANVLG